MQESEKIVGIRNAKGFNNTIFGTTKNKGIKGNPCWEIQNTKEQELKHGHGWTQTLRYTYDFA